MIKGIMTSPTIAYSVSEFITMAIFSELESERKKNPIKPCEVGKYMAFFCLTTTEYDVEQCNRGPGEPRSQKH